MNKFILGAALVLLPTSAAYAQLNPGDWVLARSRDGGSYWFPGHVASRTADAITVQFDDGTSETLGTKFVRSFTWRAGSAVECQAKDDEWYGGRITQVDDSGATVHIRYDGDGTIRRFNMGRCRSTS